MKISDILNTPTIRIDETPSHDVLKAIEVIEQEYYYPFEKIDNDPSFKVELKAYYTEDASHYRTYSLIVISYENIPCAIAFFGGRSGNDHKEVWLLDDDQWDKMVSKVKEYSDVEPRKVYSLNDEIIVSDMVELGKERMYF